jgi:hypothetical protein
LRGIALAAAIATLVAPAAVAADTPNASATASNASQTAASKSSRVLYICDGSAMTRRGFAREHGSAEYVTAEAAAQKGAGWTAPKCISPAEARKLKAKQLATLR